MSARTSHVFQPLQHFALHLIGRRPVSSAAQMLVTTEANTLFKTRTRSHAGDSGAPRLRSLARCPRRRRSSRPGPPVSAGAEGGVSSLAAREPTRERRSQLHRAVSDQCTIARVAARRRVRCCEATSRRQAWRRRCISPVATATSAQRQPVGREIVVKRRSGSKQSPGSAAANCTELAQRDRGGVRRRVQRV